MSLCEQADLTEFIEAADDTMFQNILTNDSYVLSSLLPPKTENHYNLRKKRHDRTIIIPQNTCLFDSNFIVRIVYKNYDYSH